ncbi:hypothetical protein FHETE_2620 [Fusarium heterosporum]|uniref:Uncharacterized protein n=1 Tax=Fusarium heterosporum TaxID=42747 RepID=A0A8H5WYP2_FUSHE|nr:hypothetical protein FHETE_2620 [Fusarium heterosporum]
MCLLRRITNPQSPNEVHLAAPTIFRNPDESSSVTRRRPVSDSSEDPPSPYPPIELDLLPPKSEDLLYILDVKFDIFNLPPIDALAAQEALGTDLAGEKFKRGVWAVAFAACIFAGTITGAQLKTDNEKKEAIQEFRATSPNDQIAALLSQRKSLVSQKAVLQRKIDAFELRVKEREAEKARNESNSQ